MLSLVTGHVLQRQGRGICFLLFILPSSPLHAYPKALVRQRGAWEIAPLCHFVFMYQ